MKRTKIKTINLQRLINRNGEERMKTTNKIKIRMAIIVMVPVIVGLGAGIISGNIIVGIIAALVFIIAILLIPTIGVSIMKYQEQRIKRKYGIYYNQKTNQYIIKDNMKNEIIGSIEDYKKEQAEKRSENKYKIVFSEYMQLHRIETDKGMTIGTIEDYIKTQELLRKLNEEARMRAGNQDCLMVWGKIEE